MNAPPSRLRVLLAPGLSALALFAVLVALGVWQIQRLAWKETILAQIAAAAAAPPVPLPATPGPYEKVIVAGTWIPGKAALYGDEVHDSPTGPVVGGELLLPLRRPDGSVWIVDAGWVPQQAPTPVALPPNPVGYVHAPMAPAWFSPPDDVAHGLYYTLDPARIAAGMGLSNAAPYVLIAMGPLPPPGSAAPQPVQALPTPPNNHYEYALTWFGLAATLAFQFIFFARKRLMLHDRLHRPHP